MAKKKSSKNKRNKTDSKIEALGLELYLVRELYSKLDKQNKLLSDKVRLRMEELGLEVYVGDRVDLNLKSRNLPYIVDPHIASESIPLKDFLKMINVNKNKFQEYIENNDIELSQDEYLISQGEYKYMERPKIKLPLNSVKPQLNELYHNLENLILDSKK